MNFKLNFTLIILLTFSIGKVWSQEVESNNILEEEMKLYIVNNNCYDLSLDYSKNNTLIDNIDEAEILYDNAEDIDIKWVGIGGEDHNITWIWKDSILNQAAESIPENWDLKPGNTLVDYGKMPSKAASTIRTSIYLGNAANDIYYTYSNHSINPFQLGREWLSGKGTRLRHFNQDDYFTQQLIRHKHIQKTKQHIKFLIQNDSIIADTNQADFSLAGWKGVPLFFRDVVTILSLGNVGNSAITYVGSFDMTWNVVAQESDKAVVEFNVINSTTMKSATRLPIIGYWKIWENTIGKSANALFKKGRCSPLIQTFKWTETIELIEK